jgi:RNA polymerase sigma factor (sigma-70 family)
MPEIPSHPDQENRLVECSKEGDTRAFDQLILKYGERLFGFAYHMTSHTGEADELLHEIFAKAHRSIRALGRQSFFDVWIYQIAVTTVSHHLKNRSRSPGLKLCHLDETARRIIKPGFPMGVGSPEEGQDLREPQKRINEAFQLLSESDRILITLMDVQALGAEKTAMILRIPLKSVHPRLEKARLQLQEYLADRLR